MENIFYMLSNESICSSLWYVISNNGTEKDLDAYKVEKNEKNRLERGKLWMIRKFL